MRKLFFFITISSLVCILFGGCRTKYIPVPIESTDSIIIRDTILDVQLVPYRDSTTVTPEADTPDSAASFLYNPYAYSWARWFNGKLHHSLGIWPNRKTPITLPYFYYRTQRVEVPQIVEVEKPLTRWQQFKLEVGGIAIGGCIVLFLVLVAYIYINRRKINPI